ncbi:MAG: hypothetical protein ACOC0H_02430 [Thermodesulfobacteriota bacterium]
MSAIYRPALVLWIAFFFGGCGFTVIPPPAPADPAAVFLLDHGRHASLVLPAGDKMVRYSYGDWDWYVLRQTGIAQGSRALFRPSPAGLGRKKLDASPTPASIRRAVQVPIEHLYPLSAETDRVTRLRDRLEKIFTEAEAAPRYNPAFDLEFVRHPQPYTMNHNSNTVVAEWLRELGVEVRGDGPMSRWKVASEP